MRLFLSTRIKVYLVLSFVFFYVIGWSDDNLCWSQPTRGLRNFQHLAPIKKSRVKDITSPADLSELDFAQLNRKSGEGLKYYLDIASLPQNKQLPSRLEFSYLCLQRFDYRLLTMRLQEVISGSGEENLTPSFTRIFPATMAFISDLSLTPPVITAKELGDFRKVDVFIQLDKTKLLKSYPELARDLRGRLKYFTCQINDPEENRIAVMSTLNEERILLSFIQNRSGEIIPADRQWLPIADPGDPSGYRRLLWDNDRSVFSARMHLAFKVETRLLNFFPLLKMQVNDFALDTTLNSQESGWRATGEARKVIVREANYLSFPFFDLRRIWESQAGQLRIQLELWPTNIPDLGDLTVFKLSGIISWPEYFLFSMFRGPYQRAFIDIISDCSRPTADFYFSLQKDLASNPTKSLDFSPMLK